MPSGILRGVYTWVMIQAIYKGIEIEMELHQQAHFYWKCDYTLITHPDRTKTVHRGEKEFATMDLAKENALKEACEAIDRIMESRRDRVQTASNSG
jgi:hypothetical protein